MKHAHYEIIEDDGTYWGEIPDFQGVWGRAETLKKCREELREAVEEWIVFGLRNNLGIKGVVFDSSFFIVSIQRVGREETLEKNAICRNMGK